ncbi:hypothetical protein [Mesomycoplasma molare]|uniref:Uncharacterized protein n=1 Tax=Mesomycoplasma molare TaxID=171288 RepID=A0ABY5TUA1_9BACT|nr:hypothetical protein [Mesomycoplasma molare]UWD34242.1 hypothetical protein NX772_00200 [Mesomycoplasma molare]
MWFPIVQIIIFFLWNIASSLILYWRIRKPYKTFRKTHVWGKIEKFNLLTYNTYAFASLGGLVNVIYQLFDKEFEYSTALLLSILATLMYVLSVSFYTLEIFVYFKVKQNPLWLYKEK